MSLHDERFPDEGYESSTCWELVFSFEIQEGEHKFLVKREVVWNVNRPENKRFNQWVAYKWRSFVSDYDGSLVEYFLDEECFASNVDKAPTLEEILNYIKAKESDSNECKADIDWAESLAVKLKSLYPSLDFEAISGRHPRVKIIGIPKYKWKEFCLSFELDWREDSPEIDRENIQWMESNLFPFLFSRPKPIKKKR